jgi:glutathione S-transferase
MEPIFHIADAAAWDAAAASGLYAQSTRDQTLEEVGFIHCSYRHQLLDVAQNFYADVTTPLVLLTIEPDLLDAPLVPEAPAEGAQPFPHIYGALNTGAVLSADPFVKDDNGHWLFNE